MSAAYQEQIQYVTIERPKPTPQGPPNTLNLPFLIGVLGSYAAETRIKPQREELGFQIDLLAFPPPELSLQKETNQIAFVLHEQLQQQFEEFAKQENDLKDIFAHYVAADSSVSAFLKTHRVIPRLLLEAAPRLKEYFGERVFSLQLHSEEGEAPILYGAVLWPAAISDVRRALSKFDNDWWLQKSPEAVGQLSFTYELV